MPCRISRARARADAVATHRIAPARSRAGPPARRRVASSAGIAATARQDRLRVEELRQREEQRQADEQRAVARAARLEELDADQHVEERDAGIAREEIAELRRGCRSPRPARTPAAASGAGCGSVVAVERESEPRDDQRRAGDGDPAVGCAPTAASARTAATPRAQPSCVRVSGVARCCAARSRRLRLAPETRPARSARRGDGRRPGRAAASMPGRRKRERARLALGGENPGGQAR